MREWVRLYTAAPRSPKMLALSLEAKGLYWDCLGYSGSMEDESFVPAAYVTHVTRDAVTPTEQLTESLVAARLWEPCDGGWMIHNYDERQGDEGARKDAARIRQQRHRERVKRDTSVTVTPVTRDESVTSHREEKNEKENERREDSRRASRWLGHGEAPVERYATTCRELGLGTPGDDELALVSRKARTLLGRGELLADVLNACHIAARANGAGLLERICGDVKRERLGITRRSDQSITAGAEAAAARLRATA
jgi:hypothetical protein